MRYSGGVKKLIFALLVTPSSLFAQCAMCAKSLEASRESGGPDIGAGFHWGMLFMLGMLFPLAGGLVGLVAYAARGANEATEDPAPDGDG